MLHTEKIFKEKCYIEKEAKPLNTKKNVLYYEFLLLQLLKYNS